MFAYVLISSAAIAWKHGAGYMVLPIVYFIEYIRYGLRFLEGAFTKGFVGLGRKFK